MSKEKQAEKKLADLKIQQRVIDNKNRLKIIPFICDWLFEMYNNCDKELISDAVELEIYNTQLHF